MCSNSWFLRAATILVVSGREYCANPPPPPPPQVGLHVDDLFVDLSDGRLLIRLLEIISGERIGHIGRGRLRINKIENVGKAIHFLQQKKVGVIGTMEGERGPSRIC